MSCKEHPTYKGLRLTKRAKTCQGCIDFYNENKASGCKESRGKKKAVINEHDMDNMGNHPVYTNNDEEAAENAVPNDTDVVESDDDEVEMDVADESEDEEEGCDCDVDDTTFDDVIKELELDNDAEVDSLFDFDSSDEDSDDEDDINIEDLDF